MLKVIASITLPLLVAFVAAPGGSQTAATGSPVSLKKRAQDGPYGTSAYSFRFASQDQRMHRGDVDLFLGNCGQLHVNTAGTKNRITKVEAKVLTDEWALPEDGAEGWMKQSIQPEAGALYLMEIDDGTNRMRVKFKITAVSASEVRLEWLPYRDPARGAPGPNGMCGGTHSPR